MNIKLTKRATQQFKSIQEYLEQHWGEKVLKSFNQKTIHFFDLLERYPEMGRIEVENKGIRGFLLTKHTRVFYRVKNNQIIVLAFFDVRQKPTNS